ncbi:hypothetical protein ACIQVK_19825 [Streptomyces sp. NPDC090493]|uniref:hypothetical protein n=1 Tax=Streptomyces sp. NPDC090493 TaxID=3365964 RepID=UPI003813AB27
MSSTADAAVARHSELRLAPAHRQRLAQWARDMRANRRRLGRDWTARLRDAASVLLPDPGAPLDHFLAAGGGFRVPAGSAALLGDAAADFFRDALPRDGWLYLRGWSYYAADAAMYLPGRCPPAAQRWELVQRRWPAYAAFARPLAQDAARLPAPWYRWLAFLGYLEALLNDACTARWTASRLGDRDAGDRWETAVQQVAGLLAEAAWQVWQPGGACVPELWAARAEAVATDEGLKVSLRQLGECLAAQPAVEPSAVRAIREGDVLWQVAAAFETRWPALQQAHPGQPVLLVSEAFGALAAGALWAGMVPERQRARLQLVTSRCSVHEQEMGRVPAQAWRSGSVPADGRVVVHLDDSVFTGRTHALLRGSLTGRPRAVYLVPLTLDTSTWHNHPDEIAAVSSDIGTHLDTIEELVRQPGGELPAAPSLWARRKRPDDPGVTDPVEAAMRRVRGGSDRLLALLWERHDAAVRRA